MESKWRNFVHTPSFGVWNASGEILYTRLFLVFGKHGEKFCTFGEHLYIFECDQYLLEKRVCILKHFFCRFRRLTLFLSVLESHFKCMKMRKSLTK
jgi:hypothetical protein